MRNISCTTESSKSWESDLKVIDHMKIIVPLKLLLVCNSIVSKLDGEEFSIVTHIKSRTTDSITLSEDYYIPKQKVTTWSIDYLPDDYTHCVVIHRHPNGLNSFSSTDQSFINQNFELSLLYTAEEFFVNGIFNIRQEDAIIPIPAKAEIDYGLEEIDIANIEVTRTPDIAPVNKLSSLSTEEYNYFFDDIFSEVNELLFRIEALETELQDIKTQQR